MKSAQMSLPMMNSRSMRCLAVRNGEIIVITEKTIIITEILITSLGTTVKHRISSYQRSGNKRRETQRSL